MRHSFLLSPWPLHPQELIFPLSSQSQALSPAHPLAKVDISVTQIQNLHYSVHWGTLLVDSIRTKSSPTRAHPPDANSPLKLWNRDASMFHTRSSCQNTRRRRRWQRPPKNLRHHFLASICCKRATLHAGRHRRTPNSYVIC